MATTAPLGGDSDAIALASGTAYRYVATPGAGGTLNLLWSSDGVSWRAFSNDPFKVTSTGSVPAAAVYIKAQAAVVAGSFDATAVPAVAGTLTAAQVSAIQAATIRAPTSQIDPSSYIARPTSLRVPGLSRGYLATLRTNIVVATDTISDTQLDAIEGPLDRLMKQSGWAKIVELAVFGGSALAGSLIKLKGATTTTMTGVSLVGGDYTVNTGITGNGSSKAVDTGFNPTTAGVTAADWGFGAFVTNTTASGIIAGTITGAATYLAYQVSNDSKINGSAAVSHIPYPGFNAVQISGGAVSTWTGGYQQASLASGVGTLPNVNMALLEASGSFFSSNTVTGWAAWSPGLTAAEMREMEIFFTSVAQNLWRASWQPTAVHVGDSNTTGFGLGSPTTQRYCALLATMTGLTEDNQGLNTTTMSSHDNGSSAGHWVTDFKIAQSLARRPTMLAIMLGENDVRFGVNPLYFAQDFETWLNYQFAGGVDPSQVLIINIPATTDVLSTAARQQSMNATLLNLATKYGTMYYDLWTLTNNQPTYFQGDLIHMSLLGHSVAASSIRAYLATVAPYGLLRRTGP